MASSIYIYIHTKDLNLLSLCLKHVPGVSHTLSKSTVIEVYFELGQVYFFNYLQFAQRLGLSLHFTKNRTKWFVTIIYI